MGDFYYIDKRGTSHTFFISTAKPFPTCGGDTPYPTGTGFALDGSGYQATVTNYSDMTVYDPQGNQVYPTGLDVHGNYLSYSPTGATVIDNRGLSAFGFSPLQNNQQQLGILGPNGHSQSYVVNYESIPVSTNFGQSDVTEFTGSITVISSITTPDGSTWQFSYDQGTALGHYGELTGVTLPTGGNSAYVYSNFLDTYSNENRWLTSATAGSGTTTYTPSVLSQCGDVKSGGCRQQVIVTRPSLDDTVYVQTLNHGAWNTSSTSYTGSYTSGKPLLSTSTLNTFTNLNTAGCTPSPANTSCSYYWRTASSVSTTLADTGQQSTVSTTFTSSPWYGVPQEVVTYDYAPSTGVQPVLKYEQYSWNPLNAGSAPLPSDYMSMYEVSDADNNPVDEYQYLYNQNVPVTATSNLIEKQPAVNPVYLNEVIHGINETNGTILAYDDAGVLQSSVSPNGALYGNPAPYTTTYSYDSTDSAVVQTTRATTNGVPHVSTAQYGPNVSLNSTDDENSVNGGSVYPTTYTYDGSSGNPSSGKVLSVMRPDGGTTTYSYPSPVLTNYTTTQNAATKATTSGSTTLDAYGRQSIVTTDGISTQTSYDANGRVQCVSHPFVSGTSSSTDGQECITSRDGLDRPLQLQHPDGSAVKYVYSGNIVTATDELGTQKSYTYDALGRLTLVREPDSTGALNWVTNYAYNPMNQLTNIYQEGGSSDSTQYRSSSWSYDSHDRVKQATTPEAGIICYGTLSGGSCTSNYDGDDNLLSMTTGDGVSTMSYDGLDRLSRLTATQSTASVSQNFTYDALPAGAPYTFNNEVGQLTSSVDSSGGQHYYGYDQTGRLTNQVTCTGPCTAQNAAAVTAGYDLEGNLVAMTYPDGRMITNGIDATNRLSSVQYTGWLGQPLSTPQSYWSNPSYLPTGQLQALQLGSNIQLAAAYSTRETLQNLSYTIGGTATWNRQYTWDKNAANLLSAVDPIGQVTRNFTYDTVNRLTSAIDYAGAPTPGTGTAAISGQESTHRVCQSTCTTVYDTGTVTLNVGSFSASAPYARGSTPASIATALSRLLNGSGSPVQAQVSGATVTVTSTVKGPSGDLAMSSSGGDFIATLSGSSLSGGSYGQTTQNGLNVAYTIDPWGNLSQAAQSISYGTNNQISTPGYSYSAGGAGEFASDPNNSHSYQFDQLGRMAAGSSFGGQATFVYDTDGVRVAESDASGQTTYITFDGMPIAVYSNGNWNDLIRAGSSLVAETAGNQTALPRFRLSDHLGSLAVLTDSNGNVLGTADYTPYGQTLSNSTGSTYLFTGGRRDNDIDASSAMFRDLSASQSRWLTPDPSSASYDLSDPQTLNRYAYVANRPMSAVDPSGLLSSADDGGGSSSPIDDVPIIGQLYELLSDIFGNGAPAFHGSTRPRPESAPGTGNPNYDDPLKEHLGLPSWIHQVPTGLAGLINLPQTGCEFGACPNTFSAQDPNNSQKDGISGVINIDFGIQVVLQGLLKSVGCAIVGTGRGLQSFYGIRAAGLAKNFQNGPPGRSSLLRAGRDAYAIGAPSIAYNVGRLGPLGRLAGDFIPVVGPGLLYAQGALAISDGTQAAAKCVSAE